MAQNEIFKKKKKRDFLGWQKTVTESRISKKKKKKLNSNDVQHRNTASKGTKRLQERALNK